MNKNRIFSVANRVLNILVLIAMLAFFGVFHVQAGTNAQESRPLATPDLINQALKAGLIDADTANLFLAYALGDYEKLPQEYRSDVPWEGTLTLLGLNEALSMQSAGRYQEEISVTLSPGGACSSSTIALPNVSNSTHFHIEYGTIGGGLNIASYSTSLETAWTKEITSFGWAAPPVLASNPPPGNRYHVRIANLGGGLYGFVSSSGVHAGLVGNNPNTAWNDVDAYASCMVLNSDYSAFPGTSQQALDATTGHEFNHSIQFGYGALTGSNRPASIFIEGGATWMEDEAFDTANDNYNYLWPTFSMSMGNYTDSPYPYWITFRGLTERYGTGSAGAGEQVMQDFWEIISQGSSGNGVAALNTALSHRGTNLNAAFHAYAIAVKFNKTCGGSFVYPYCFEEASGYVANGGATSVHGSIGSIGNSYSGSVADNFAINWVSLPTGSSAYRVTLQNTSSGGSLRGSIVCDTGSALNITAFPSVNVGAGSNSIVSSFNPSGCNSVVGVITNQSTATTSTARSYTLSTNAIVPPPGAATLVSPSGAITDTSPTYTWNKVNASTWYYLWVNNAGGTPVIQQWYQSAAVCGASTCSITPSTVLTGGNYTWWIQTWNDGGYGPWSAGMSFSLPTVAPPGAATLVSPSGAITDTTPTYTWNKVNDSTWYYLWVNKAGTPVIQQWYQSAAVCGASTCSITPSTVLTGGNYTWWIQTWNDGGYGPWSAGMNFSLPAGGFNSQFNGSSTGWQVHSGSWFIDSGQWYSSAGTPGFFDSVSYNSTFSTLDYRVRLWKIGNGPAYLMVRGTPTPLTANNDWAAGYSVGYTPNGNFSVWKSTGGGAWTALQNWTFSSAIIQGGAWNNLRVIATGSSLYFYINGTLVWTATDSSLSSGRVGIEWYDANTNDQLWVDWATLTDIVARITDTVSAEQQALNEAARQAGTGDKRYSPGN